MDVPVAVVEHVNISTAAAAAAQELKMPKRRSESWSHEEICSLVGFRKDLADHFNMSKSNKHLWDQISSRMRDHGFERTATMCTDKWRNLLKEYKRAKHCEDPDRPGLPKARFHKELEEILGHQAKPIPYQSAAIPALPVAASASPVLAKGLLKARFHKESEEISGHRVKHIPNQSTAIPALPIAASVGPVVANEVGGSPANPERGGVVQEGQPAVSGVSHDANLSNCMSSWNWRDGSPNNVGERGGIPAGRVITVRFGEMTRRIGIDGTTEAIKEAIRCAFSLRSKRGFWLEDEDGIIRCFDRDLPLGSYSLNLDEGVTVKICVYSGDRLTGVTEERTLFAEEDFGQFLAKRGWTSLREMSGYKDIESIADLRPMAVYERGGTHKISGL